MNLKFKEDQSEEYYRKLLLLDKVKPILSINEKQYIFNEGYCWDILFNEQVISYLCYQYAINVIKGKFPEGEKAIATDAKRSYYYARNILSDRFPLGENAITRDSYMSFSYAIDVLRGRFELGERSIAGDATYSFYYAKRILEGRFPLGEPSIMNSLHKDEYLEFLEEIGKRHELKI